MTDQGNAPKRPAVCFVSASAAIAGLLTEAPALAVGGAEVQQVQFARGLVDRGWDVSFVTQDAGQCREARSPKGIRVLAAYDVPEPTPRLHLLTHKLPRLSRSLGDADADVYVVRAGSWLTGVVAMWARLHRRRSVFWTASRMDPQQYVTQDGWPRHAWWLYRWGVRHVDLLLSQSEEQAASMQLVAGRTAEVVRNIWNVPPVHLDGQKRGVLWVGNLRPLKRPHMLLDVAEQMPSVQFTMVGGKRPDAPELYEEVRARANALPNADFRGFVPFDEMGPLYAKAQVLACTSEIEGFPNTFLQAWCSGTPVASTVDPDGVISEHCLGSVCGTASDMAEAIASMLSDLTAFADMQERCRRYVRQFHSLDVVVPRLDDLLRRTIRRS